MKIQPQCNSEYNSEIRCELIKGHKGQHQCTKYWDDAK